jgi:hypothetical protein
VKTNRQSVGGETHVYATIFTALDGLDLSNKRVVISYIISAYNAIKQQGYIEGSGDRTLLKALIVAEEKNGTMLTREKISHLQSALDIFELDETTLPLREHENIYFLISVYNTVAAAFLDVREEDIQLDELFQKNMQVCKLYSYGDIGYLKFFAQSLSRYASDIRLSRNAAANEKQYMLSELAHDMKMLKLLIDKMLNLELEYQKSKDSVSQAFKSEVLGKLEEAILLCVSEAVKGNPEPQKWFYMLWERVNEVNEVAKKFVNSYAKNDGVFLSPKLTDMMNKTILNDKVLKLFAEHCATYARAEFKNNV